MTQRNTEGAKPTSMLQYHVSFTGPDGDTYEATHHHALPPGFSPANEDTCKALVQAVASLHASELIAVARQRSWRCAICESEAATRVSAAKAPVPR